MPWFRVDDSFYDHPKVFDAPDCAVALWVRAGTWSARNLTDGYVPSTLLARLCGDPETAAAELVQRRLWSRVKGGYRFHGWAGYQPTRESVEGDRAAARERMERLRADRSSSGKAPVTHRRAQRSSSGKDSEPKSDSPRSDSELFGRTSGEQNPKFGRSSRPPTRPDPIDNPPQHPSGAAPPAKRATRIPDDFKVTEAMGEWARQKTPHVNGPLETEKFIDYWHAESSARASKRDWAAAWRTWMRRAAERTPSPGRHTRQAETDQLFDEAFARARERDAQEAVNDQRGNGAAHAVRQSLLPPAGDR